MPESSRRRLLLLLAALLALWPESAHAYLGPGAEPEFPNYEFLIRPLDHVKVTKYLHECNYLQANEGNYDLSHLNFLHYLRFRLAGA